MRFEDIIGLKETKEKLIRSALRNHHAQVFFGPPGSANMAMALAYLSYVNCENPGENDSCGTCPSCQKIDKLIHPDVHFIFPVSATQKWKGKDVVSNNFLPEWREFLQDHSYPTLNDWVAHYGAENKQVNISKEESRQIIHKLSLKAFEAKYKVMVIWLPEWMHPSAANAILKILEEPPKDTIFLLVSHDYQRLLTTITSRTQLVNIRANTTDEVVAFLTTRLALEQQKAQRIARLSQGDMSMAQKLVQQDDPDSSFLFSQWMRHCWQNDFTRLVDLSEQFHTLDKLSQKNLFSQGLTSLRSAALSGKGVRELVINGEDEDEFVHNFGQAVSLKQVEKISGLLDEAHYHLERNASAKMTYLDLSLKISQILKTKK